MVSAGSLLFSCEMGTHNYNGHKSHYKGAIEKGHLHLFSITLSSHASWQDAWSLHLVNSVRRQPSPVSTKCKFFVCRSVFTPIGGNEIPVLKTAATVLTRSYNAFHRSPVVLKLVPAVGIIVFAAWGLGPFVCLCRILLLQKNDGSWKKSSTHYVLTSYLQPLLLWSGTALICRVLDPVILPSESSQAVKQRLLNFVRSLSTVLAFAYCLSSLIQQMQKFFAETKDSSDERDIMVSCFVKTSRFEEYMCVKEAILLDLLRVISHHRARLATPIRTVQKIYNEPDVESTFADTISTRSTAATNRPFLLIETNKINGDDKTKASTRSDSKIDFKDGSTSNLDNAQTDDKVTSASGSDSDSNGKASATSTSKTKTPYADAPIGSSGDILPGEGSSLKSSAVSQGSGSEKTHISPATSPTKQDGERPVSVLEDNIVLGVALDGSKRTLPIEEDMVHSPIIEEPKELAAWRNGNGSTTLGKEKNDDQIPIVPGAVPSDQREK